MAVLQMQRITLCALKKDRKGILEMLQLAGTVEIDKPKEDYEGFGRMDTASQKNVFEKKAVQAENALGILDSYAPEKKGMLASLEGSRQLSVKESSAVVDRQDSVMETADTIVQLAREIAENSAAITKKENQKEILEPWKDLDIPQNFSGTDKTVVFLGTLPGMFSLEQIITKMQQVKPKMEAFHVQIVHTDQDATYLCIIGYVQEEELLEEALRSIGFVRWNQMSGRTPAESQKKRDEEIAALKKENEQLSGRICSYKDKRDDLKTISDYYRTRAEKYEVLGGLLQSQNTFILTGYVPQKEAAGLKAKLEKQFELSVELEDLKEDEDMPILLSNNKFSQNFEGVVASYGLPHKGELDPTTIMSFCYFFLFGMMLSDAAYGFIIFVACMIVLKKFPNMDAGMKKAIAMFKWCGLSTLIWGILFGGYFGDLIDVVAKTWFGVTLADGQSLVPALWFVPLNDPMRLLIYSLFFGVIHLYLGLAMKAVNLIRNGKVLDAVWDVASWYVFLTGLIFMLLPSSLFAGMSGMSFPASLGTIGKYMALAGMIVIILMSARDNKNLGLRFALGLYEIYGVTSWLSDLLSYSRLLALGLATGVIAQVINQMGSMLTGIPVLGTILFIIVLIVGTVLNMAINLLGAYVHTNRLQYVEFFGKFYEGGGRPFTPFTTIKKYVNVKEEN